MRVRIAASPLPSVIAGSTRYSQNPRPKIGPVPAPETGVHPSLIEKIKIRIGPSAKFGNDSPPSDTIPSTRSCQRPRCSADHTPAGTEIPTPISSAASVSANVYGYRSSTRCITESCSRSDCPRSACSTPRQ